MKLHQQYINAYEKGDSHYVYYADSEIKIELVAGKDGVTSAHIAELKKLHRAEMRSENRNHRRRWNGERHAWGISSYDALNEGRSDCMDVLLATEADPAAIYQKKQETAGMRLRLQSGWRRLNPRQKALLRASFSQTQGALAAQEGVSQSSIHRRLQTIRKKFC